jgi:hypothetical protein
LPKHGIYKCGFSMVNVGNDGNISKVVADSRLGHCPYSS